METMLLSEITPAYVLESTMRTFLFTIQYNIITNNFLHDIIAHQHKGDMKDMHIMLENNRVYHL